MIQVDCPLQQYAWGRKGSKSLAALLKQSAADDFSIDEEACYAELWMGTHPSGPSRVQSSKQLLSEFLSAAPELVGQVPASYAKDNLPFLFKVLSVRTALSIQTHPNKELAQELHSKFPNIYKDPNHKPEMVIALTDFEALCGFRTLAEIKSNIATYPELTVVVNQSTEDKTVSALFDSVSTDGAVSLEVEASTLRAMFDKIMTSPAALIEQQLNLLIPRLRANINSPLDELLVRLYDQYGNDVGVFCPLVMNFVQMKPGDSFFIGANELHAYIAGECVECMALSDNVVRAGLTPKLRDCPTLLAMLNYISRMPNFLTPLKRDEVTSIYRPPADTCAEFEVEVSTIPADATAAYALPVLQCASILLLVRGTGKAVLTDAGSSGSSTGSVAAVQSEIDMKTGCVVFVAAGAAVAVTPTAAGDACIVYRAHVNLGAA